MKKIILFFGAAVFMTVLFVNVSISANKKAANSGLLGFTSEANAECEQNELTWVWDQGRCNFMSQCWISAFEYECTPEFFY